MQDDILFDLLTCWECLEFAAWLWLNAHEDKVQARVNELIQQLGLEGC